MPAIYGKSKQKVFKRKLFLTERSYLVSEAMCPLVMNQVVFEGSGAINPSDLRRAIEIASKVNPGSRLILKGFLWTCHWVDSGVTPVLKEIDGSGWSGRSSENAPFLEERLSPYGPNCEVLLLNGDPLRLVFRSHHAVMDGRGTLTWAEDVFRVLKGEEAHGSNSRISEINLASTFQKEYRRPFPHDNIPPTGRAQGDEKGSSWRRVSLSGKFSKLLPKVALLIAQEARRYSDGKVRMSVPVDIRPRYAGLRSTANLTLGLYIEISTDTTLAELTEEISSQLAKKMEGMVDRWDFLALYIPIRVMAYMGKKRTIQRQKTGLYGLSCILTNPGKVSMDAFSMNGFKAKTVFFIPPAFEYFPAVMSLSGSPEGVEMLLSVPKVLATNGRLDAAIRRIAAGLKPD